MRLGALVLTTTILAPLAWGAPPPPTTRSTENLIQVSWGDQIVMDHGDAALDTPEKVRRIVDDWKSVYDGQTILWRGASYYLERFYEKRGRDNAGYRGRVAEIMSRFDPIAVARERAHANGQKLLIYMTFLDHGAPHEVLYGGTTPFPWQDRFTIDNPHFQDVDRRGNYHHGILELAYPECRRLMVERMMQFIEEYKTDGVYVCSRTHSLPALHADQYGFSPPIVAEMKRRHDVDITTDARFDYQSEHFKPDEEIVEAWRRLRGEYLVQFYRELRAAIPRDKTIYTGFPRGRYLGPPYGNLYLDWESIVKEKLVDGLVLRVTSTKDLHTPLYVPHAKIGYRCSEDDDINIPSMEACAKDIYGPLTQAHGVKLFWNTTFYGPRKVETLRSNPPIRGIMLWTPSIAPNRGRIAHDEAFCFPGGEMTVEMDLYLNPRPHGHQRVLSKYDHEADDTRGWECLVASGGKLQFKVNQVDAQTGKATDAIVSTADPIPVQRWLRVALEFDRPNRRMRIYLDGKVAAEQAIADLPMRVNPSQDVFVGRNGAWYWHYLDGKLDNLVFRAATIDNPKEPFAAYRFERTDGDAVMNDVDRTKHPLNLLNREGDVLTREDGRPDASLDMTLEREAN